MSSRPVSSSVVYPFIPGADRRTAMGIKDAVFEISGTYSGTVQIQGAADSRFVYLKDITAAGVYTFRACRAGEVPDSYAYIDITFSMPASADGLGSVRSSDGRNVLFASFSEIIREDISYTPSSGMLVEPCCIRWMDTAVRSVTLVNEQRLSNPEDRVDLLNRTVKVFTPAEPPALRSGYNAELSFNNGDIEIICNPGGGAGKAPYNKWEDIQPPDPDIKPLLSVNGEHPADDGDILIKNTSSITVSTTGNKVTITELK